MQQRDWAESLRPLCQGPPLYIAACGSTQTSLTTYNQWEQLYNQSINQSMQYMAA